MTQLTLDQAMREALQHHHAGRLQQAEQIYRQILAQSPDYAPALHCLGLVAHQAGRSAIAVDLIRRAIALRPNDAESHSNLGSALKGMGQLDDAIAAYQKAIALRPDYAEACYNLALSLADRGLIDQAIAAYRRTIALRPGLAEAHHNLGKALTDKGLLDQAIAAFRCAVALRPSSAEALLNLATALMRNGLLDEATMAYRQAIALTPACAQAHDELGNALAGKGELDEAVASYRQAIALRPNYAEAHNNLGAALTNQGRLDQAIDALRQAIVLRPNYAEAHSNLANALTGKGQLDQAIAAARKAIALAPDLPEAHHNLGTAMKDNGLLDEAIAAYRQAVALRPGHAAAHSNLLFTIHYHAAYDAQEIVRKHRLWNEQHARPLQKFRQPHPNDRSPERRLRIGYVSPDFRNHVVGRNLLPLFREHGRGRFEFLCYSNMCWHDELTTQFRAHCDGWRDIAGLADQLVADLVRQDGIDILVDLTLHMAHNRLLVFARKPAPVQVTFAGYPGSTGLEAMDYRLSDPYLDPPGPGDEFYCEQTVRLPDSFWCYDPAVMTAAIAAEPQAGPLPALSNQHVTFGCLNNFCKVNDRVLALWARVLKAAPGSRLMLMAPQGSARQRSLEVMAREGIDPARIEFVASAPLGQYLQRYGRIDIGLDTFPYNGHTTSLDGLWMGVPLVTLVGKTVVGRAGLSQLTNLGLTELVAMSEDSYVRIAAELAGDLSRLSELRAGLRQRMRQSVLTDAPRFARNIEAAYRQMWRRWCRSSGKAGP